MRIISLGWGVQSFTLAAMAALGELDADFAIHADTGFEKSDTYAFAAKWQPWLEQHKLQVITVGGKNQVITGDNVLSVSIPAYTDTRAKEGQIRRQCTSDWKIFPVRRFLSEELRRRNIPKKPGCVVLKQGISLDEFQRMRVSDVQWITNAYPLVDLRMTRADCILWLEKHKLEVPPRSACVFCPFQKKAEWLQLKRTSPTDWQTAVAIDASIRNVRPPNRLFVHPTCQPLDVAVRIAEDVGYSQPDLFDEQEPSCDSGYCFT